MNKCCQRKFKLVLTDIQMPILDGFQVATMILAVQNYLKLDSKQSDIASDVKIVAVTACRSGIELKAKRAGMLKILDKPVQRDEL